MENNVSFELILHAGNAMSLSMESLYDARENRFEEAEEKLLQADKEINEAHKIQSDLLFKMANNEKVEVDVLLVHAQDHLSMAMVTRNFAEEILCLRKQLNDKQ